MKNDFKTYRNKYESIAVEPMTEELIEKAFEINDVPELHDRLIAGTALKAGISDHHTSWRYEEGPLKGPWRQALLVIADL